MIKSPSRPAPFCACNTSVIINQPTSALDQFDPSVPSEMSSAPADLKWLDAVATIWGTPCPSSPPAMSKDVAYAALDGFIELYEASDMSDVDTIVYLAAKIFAKRDPAAIADEAQNGFDRATATHDYVDLDKRLIMWAILSIYVQQGEMIGLEAHADELYLEISSGNAHYRTEIQHRACVELIDLLRVCGLGDASPC